MSERRVVTRRDFVRGTAGAAVGVSLFGVGWAEQAVREPRSATVILVRDQRALSASHQVDVPVLREMLAETVTRVTGEGDAARRLALPGQARGHRWPGAHQGAQPDAPGAGRRGAELAHRGGHPCGAHPPRAGRPREGRGLHRADLAARPQGPLAHRHRHGAQELHHVLGPPVALPRREQRPPRRDLAAAPRQGEDPPRAGGCPAPAVRQGAAARPALPVGLQGADRRHRPGSGRGGLPEDHHRQARGAARRALAALAAARCACRWPTRGTASARARWSEITINRAGWTDGTLV